MADIRKAIARRERRKILQKEKRIELRKKNICIVPGCGCKCPPITIHYQRCPKHHGMSVTNSHKHKTKEVKE